MKRWKEFVALTVALVLLAAAALATNDLRTVTAEEYALLEKYRRLEEVLEVVDAAYLWEYDLDRLLEGAAQGMLGALDDDYTFYYTPEQMEREDEAFTGEYGGLGIEVYPNTTDQLITVMRVFYDSPAQQAGLRAGDKIIQVNGEDMTAFDLNKAVSIMRGEIGGEVELTILRDMEVLTINCVRAVIQTEILSYEMLENGVGYVRIHYFEGNATGQFEEAMDKFRQQGVRALVIDLRGNRGGFINLAIDIADIFLGDVVITASKDKYGRKLSYYGTEGKWDIPIAILMDEGTASAAEIIAAALKENGAATLVGTKSYGKGIMQSVFTFPQDGAGMQITSEYWLTPTGENIHEIGLMPDVEVELPEDALDGNFQIIREKDTQLDAGIELLLEELGA